MSVITTSESSSHRPSQLLMLSASTLSALETATTNLATYLWQHPELDLVDVAYTLQVRYRACEHRRVLVCSGLEVAAQALEQRDPRRVYTARFGGRVPSVVWLFPGQGSQYVGMAQGLYQHEPIFRQQVDHCAQILQAMLGIDIRAILYPTKHEEKQAREQLDQTWLIQPILFVVEYALAQLWMAWGIRPQAMIGHSLGEYVAACLAEVFSLEDALRLVVARGQLMQQAGTGAMLAVFLPASEVQSLLEASLSLAAVNSLVQCVISGPTEAIHALHKRLNEQNIESRLMDVDVAAHSEMMRPVAEKIRPIVETLSFRPPQIPYISNLTGTWVRNSEAMDPEYWEHHMCQTVRFADGLTEIFQEKDLVLLEVGPGQALTAFARQHPANTSQQIILPSIRDPHEKTTDVEFLLRTLGKLWLTGVEIGDNAFYAGQRRHELTLPIYPFEHQQDEIKLLDNKPVER